MSTEPTSRVRPEDALRKCFSVIEDLAATMRTLADQIEDDRAERERMSDAMTPAECASDLGVSAPSVIRAIKRGALVAEKYGPKQYRIRRSSWEAYKKRHRLKP